MGTFNFAFLQNYNMFYACIASDKDGSQTKVWSGGEAPGVKSHSASTYYNATYYNVYLLQCYLIQCYLHLLFTNTFHFQNVFSSIQFFVHGIGVTASFPAHHCNALKSVKSRSTSWSSGKAGLPSVQMEATEHLVCE